MSITKNGLNEIRNLIFDNDMENALKNLFHNNSLESKYQDEVIVLSSNWKENSRKERLGVLSNNEITISRNRIRLSVLQLIRELEANHDLFREKEYDAIIEKQIFIPEKKSIKGFWRQTNGNGKVYFDQKGNKIIGLYDIAGMKRVGYYSGILRETDVFEFKWQWFNDKTMFGYGQFLIMYQEMLGKYWVDKETEDLGEIRYSFIQEKRPKWAEKELINNLWKRN